MGIKLSFDTLTTMEDRARFAASQIVRFNRNSKQCIDYAAVVSDHLLNDGITYFSPIIVDHILDQLKRKIQRNFPRTLI